MIPSQSNVFPHPLLLLQDPFDRVIHSATHHDPSCSLATTTPLPKRPLPRKPALNTVRIARPFAFARICGGMILSGPKACLGSTKDARIRPHFLHSPNNVSSCYCAQCDAEMRYLVWRRRCWQARLYMPVRREKTWQKDRVPVRRMANRLRNQVIVVA